MGREKEIVGGMWKMLKGTSQYLAFSTLVFDFGDWSRVEYGSASISTGKNKLYAHWKASPDGFVEHGFQVTLGESRTFQVFVGSDLA